MPKLTMLVPERILEALELPAPAAGKQLLLAAAMKLYELGRLSSGAAADLAGVPHTVFMSKLADYNISTSHLTHEELHGGLARSKRKKEFAALADQWRHETRHLSSDHEIAMNRAYQQIIGLGEGALPLILQELQQRLDHWFWALTMIAGESPVPQNELGNQRLMRDRWLEWGRRHGYIS